MSENLITAKIFKNGGNQAVCIPVERKSWAEFFALPLPEVPFEREAEITISKPDLF